jgi:hypothetical protein
MIQGNGHFLEMELALLAPLCQPAILSQQVCTPFEGELDIRTPIMESSVALKAFAPDFWTLTQKLVFPLGIASGMAFMRPNRFISRGLKPANISIDWAHEL